MRRVLVILALASLALSAQARRRAVSAPAGDGFALASLRPVVGSASIVALGDATHGTHEFYALRLPMIEYLVREMGFDVLSIEGPFALFERINVYAQGGPGDPRALLAEASQRLRYFFWNVEEMLAVIEWVRAYNLAHERKIAIAGADIYDYEGAAAAVMARHPDADYSCVVRGERDGECEATARAVRDALLARGADADTIHYADIVLQAFHLQLYEPREESMAANLLWIREHRGSKVIHWGHQEHVGKLPSPYARGRTMGTILSERLGSDYVAIGTLAG
ncbi:MAG TPA: erythromycin esterase family protein, partial [Thermoanaerobaculia bacterium]|nr:erythromycin esterase family protein [Thermoanaerobaculia bacterium]